MTRIDPNKLAVLVVVVILAVLAVRYGYRLEIGMGGLKLENSVPARAVGAPNARPSPLPAPVDGRAKLPQPVLGLSCPIESSNRSPLDSNDVSKLWLLTSWETIRRQRRLTCRFGPKRASP